MSTIVYERVAQTETFTRGIFYITGTDISGYMLEPRGPDTVQANMNRRIPEGTYNLNWNTGSKYPGVLRLSNNQVPYSRGILIHNGNTSIDTSGCLLPGLKQGLQTVGKSGDALGLINNHFRRIGTNGARIIIKNGF